jgi:anti-anti-sigma regulatory factor
VSPKTHSQVSPSITRSMNGGVEFVQFHGVLDMSSARALGLAARALIDDDPKVIYLDLGSITVMGSPLVAFLRQLGSNRPIPRSLILCRLHRSSSA